MLCRKRGGAQHETTHPFHMHPDFVYKVDNIRGRDITWQVRTIQPGQLPLSNLNKPDIKIKERQQYILSRTSPEKSAAQMRAENLAPGVKVHHEIFQPNRFPSSNQQAFIPGETIHHTLKPFPQDSPMQPKPHIHHTIENSPGYFKAQAGGTGASSQPTIIHHTIKDSPGMQHGNPGNIVKPVRIVEHHTLNANPPMRINGRIIKQPLIPPANKRTTPRENDLPGNRR